MTQQSTSQTLVYVGTYTRDGSSRGIYIYRYDPASGALSHLSTTTGIDDPSYLAIHPNRRYLYSVAEVTSYGGKSSGAVAAYSIDQKSGTLTELARRPTGGPGPCHLTVEKTGRFVLTANYNGGSVCVHPIRQDGSLGEMTDFVQHQGSSVNPQRQAGPHAHSVNMDPGNRLAFVADLGLDRVMIYRLDMDSGKLRPNDPPHAQVAPGAGPRHFDFHPSGKFAYIINELGSTVTAFTYDGSSGRLSEVQTVSTLPEGFSGSNTTADVHVHPTGRFLYGSNRGHDSIAIFAIDEASGKLTPVGHAPTQGRTPRNFAIDPSGRFLLAANQNTDTIVTFRIDHQTGQLQPTGHVTQVPRPVCLKFLAL